MSGPTLLEALRDTIADLMAKDRRVFVIGEDVGVLGGAFGITAGLLDRYGPERVRDAPISETAILGAAIGAAIMGERPICEMQFVDFMFVALDQLLHQAATAHYASGGAVTVPLVVRANYGVGPGAGPQDSGTLYGALLQFPGLTVVIPSSAAEGERLLRQAVEDPNPVLFLEPRELYRARDVADALPPLPMRKARVLRQGGDVTCVAVGGMLRKALAAAEKLAGEGIAAEVIDLRCVMPLDAATILNPRHAPAGSWRSTRGRAAAVWRPKFSPWSRNSDAARARPMTVRRLTGVAAPVAYAAHLARAAVPDAAAVEAALREMAQAPRA